MTEPIQLYPQTKIRISATYRAARGATASAGRPESVEIEINEQVPAEALLAFVTGLVDSLLVGGAEAVTTDVAVDPDPAGEPGTEVEVQP